jgi:hypothetical protein
LARFTTGGWRLYAGTSQFPSLNSIDAYRALNFDGTTGPLVERTTTRTRAWTEKPPNDDTGIRVLWSDGEVIVDRGENCQSPWYGTGDQTHEVGWTTVGEWAAFLTRPAAIVADVTEDDVRSALGLDGSAGRVAAALNAMKSSKSSEIAAHVAAEVAAERARCVVPEVVRRTVEHSALDLEVRAASDKPQPHFGPTAVALRAWLDALPPIAPEGE